MTTSRTAKKTTATKGKTTGKKPPAKRPSAHSAAHLDDPDPATGARDKGRFVSQERLSQILGRNRATVREWQSMGMPAVEIGDRNLRKSWVYDIAAVVKWREEQAAERVRKELTPIDKASTPSNFSALLDPEVAKGIDATLKLVERRGYAVPVHVTIDIMTRERRETGNRIVSIPDLVARQLSGYPADMVQKFTTECKQKINALLKAVAADADEAFNSYSPTPEEEYPAEDDE